MKIVQAVRDILKKLNYILSNKEKVMGIVVLLLTFVESLTELLGVSVIVPLIQAFIDPSVIIESDMAQTIMHLLMIENGDIFIVLLFVCVAMVFVIKNILALIAKYVSVKFSCAVMRGLGTRMMRTYMEREYLFFVNTNVSEIYRGMNTDVVRVYEMLNSGIQLIKSGLIVTILFLYLLFTNWWITIGLISIIGIIFLIIYCSLRKVMRVNGEKYRTFSSIAVKNVLEAFAGIKEILVLKRQTYFVDAYDRNYAIVQKAQVKKTMAEGAPTHILEAVLVSGVMIGMGYAYLALDSFSTIVPMLAAFAYACTRVMPLMGTIAGGVNTILFQKVSLDAVYSAFIKLNENKPSVLPEVHECRELHFIDKIEFKGVHWTYGDESRYVLEGLNLTINKGESIAFIGKSGAGKSTLVDIILGLYIPQKGKILVDGLDVTREQVDWSGLVGYVPQTNYLLDDTIRRNIAFGIAEEEIDNEKIEKAIEKAQLKEYIDSLPEGVNTIVGERGIRLSGGQRQRIVIARALYNEPEILILDEATSALDGDTEGAVVKALDKLKGDLTLIVVAHRLSTIKDCDHIYEIDNGRATEQDKKVLFS